MVEAGASEIPEAEILDALDIAHAEIKKICAVQHELREQAGKPKMEMPGPVDLSSLDRGDPRLARRQLDEATQVVDKLDRQDATKAVEAAVVEQYTPAPDAPNFEEARVNALKAFAALEKQTIRQRIAIHKKRPDGRAEQEIRPISIEVGVAPRTHGSRCSPGARPRPSPSRPSGR
jgi:polyribonucleotide nucleotidyltransferase